MHFNEQGAVSLSERHLLDEQPTFQAQSAPGDIDHLKITGAKGISSKPTGRCRRSLHVGASESATSSVGN
jgi:hypothetical protein